MSCIRKNWLQLSRNYHMNGVFLCSFVKDAAEACSGADLEDFLQNKVVKIGVRVLLLLAVLLRRPTKRECHKVGSFISFASLGLL